MKIVKQLLAVLLSVAMLASFAACHPKDEIAVTAGDVEFTSAYYMCALINAKMQAKSKVDEQLSEKKEDSEDADAESTDEETDYYAQKIEDKSFVEWVEDTAMDYLKKMAVYKTFCKKYDLTIAEEDAANVESYASYYWSYGYSNYFEPNGVSQKTYTEYMKDSYYSNLYFDYLYGKDGEKAISDNEIAAKIKSDFVIADTLEASFSSEEGEEAVDTDAVKKKFEEYAAALKKGEKTFEEVYKDYKGKTKAEEAAENEQSTEKDDSPTAKDAYATVFGPEDTTYTSTNYETVKAMKIGEAKTVATDSGVTLLLKQDITKDDYYQTTLDETVRHLIADDDYDKLIEEAVKELKVSVNSYAVKQFKVKKIKEPEASS